MRYKTRQHYLLINMAGGTLKEPHGNIWKMEKSNGKDRKPKVEKNPLWFSYQSTLENTVTPKKQCEFVPGEDFKDLVTES